MTKILRRPPKYEQVDIRNPTEKVDTYDKIGQKEKLRNLCGRDSERNFSEKFGTASGKISDIENREGNPQEWSRALNIFQKAKMFGIYLVKQNKLDGNMPAMPEDRYKLYGRSIRLADQPQEGSC